MLKGMVHYQFLFDVLRRGEICLVQFKTVVQVSRLKSLIVFDIASVLTLAFITHSCLKEGAKEFVEKPLQDNDVVRLKEYILELRAAA